MKRFRRFNLSERKLKRRRIHRSIICRGTIKDLFGLISSILIPVVLGIFTILSTNNQWKIENNRSEKESKLEATRNELHVAMNLDSYRNDLLGNYIKEMSDMLKDTSFSLVNALEIATLMRAKTLNVAIQLDSPRVTRLLRFLYEAKLIANKDNRSMLDISTLILTDADRGTLKAEKHIGILTLQGIVFENSSFTDIILEYIDFSFSTIRNVSFLSSKTAYEDQSFVSYYSSTNVQSSVLKYVKLQSTTLEDVHYSSTKVQDTILEKAQLKSVTFIDGYFHQVDFKSSLLIDVDFSFSHFVSVDFSASRMKNVNFANTVFYNVTFSRSIMINVNFTLAIFYHVNFREIQADGVSFISAAFGKS